MNNPTRTRGEHVVEENPRNAPRRRITYTPAEHVPESCLHSWWRIEEHFEATSDAWREIGRELVAEPTIVSCNAGAVPE